jgi:hypothetical protein
MDHYLIGGRETQYLFVSIIFYFFSCFLVVRDAILRMREYNNMF